jgi:hypothetical protein
MSELAMVPAQDSSALYPTPNEWNMMKDQAQMLISSGFLPTEVKSPQQALAIMMKGREVGMPPMQAFAHINVIKGKPTLSAEGMLALIFKNHPKTKLKYLQNDNDACIMVVTKPGNEPSTFAFSMEDAKKAQLTKNHNWQKYARAMLRSRAISEMARSLFPECLMGVSYTQEELEPPQPGQAIASAGQAHVVQAFETDAKPDKWVQIERLVKSFMVYGIPEKCLEEIVAHMLQEPLASIKDFSDRHFDFCRKLFKNLKDGDISKEDIFDMLHDDRFKEEVKAIESKENDQVVASDIENSFSDNQELAEVKE